MTQKKELSAGTIFLTSLLIGGLAAFFFGFMGFCIGFVICAIMLINSNKTVESVNIVDPGTPDAEPQLRTKTLNNLTTSYAMEETDFNSNEASFDLNKEYIDALVTILAGCMSSDGTIGKAESSMANSLIRNDDFIVDKEHTTERVKEKVAEYLSCRKQSKSAFNLKVANDLNQIKYVRSKDMRERLGIITDGMMEALDSTELLGAEDFVKRIRDKLIEPTPAITKSEAAERYILQSGNREAIAALSKMRKDPGGYANRLQSGARHNSVLRTALGVFTGVIAADIVTDAVYQHQLEQAFSSVEDDFDSTNDSDPSDIDQYSSSDFDYNAAEDTDIASVEPDDISGAEFDQEETVDDESDSGDFDFT